MHSLNGRFSGDINGSFTCFANNGASLVDYIVCSTALFGSIEDFCVHTHTESDHFPVSCSLVGDSPSLQHSESETIPSKLDKYVWKESRAADCIDTLNVNIQKIRVDYYSSLCNHDTSEAAELLSTTIQQCAGENNLKVKCRTLNVCTNEAWYDDEYHSL